MTRHSPYFFLLGLLFLANCSFALNTSELSSVEEQPATAEKTDTAESPAASTSGEYPAPGDPLPPAAPIEPCPLPTADAAANFLWGIAASGFQSEPGPSNLNLYNQSDWYEWLFKPVLDGDKPKFVEESSFAQGPDFAAHYAQDLASYKALGFNTVRVSIEWSRLFPVEEIPGADPSTATKQATIGGAKSPATLDYLADAQITTEMLAAIDARVQKHPQALAALTYYTKLLNEIERQGLIPVVSLYHFVLPSWLHEPVRCHQQCLNLDPQEIGNCCRPGWLAPRTVKQFALYAAYVAYKFGSRINNWVTLVEPSTVVAGGYLNPACNSLLAFFFGTTEPRTFPPCAFSPRLAYHVTRALVNAHVLAYRAVKQFDANGAKISAALNMIAPLPASSSTEDQQALANFNYMYNEYFLEALVRGELGTLGVEDEDQQNHRVSIPAYRDTLDYIGLNYYFPARIDRLPDWQRMLVGLPPLFNFNPQIEVVKQAFSCKQNSDGETPAHTEMGWAIEQVGEGLRGLLKMIAPYNKEIIITENGAADANPHDACRMEYLRRIFSAIKQSIVEDGVNVRGYYYWSGVDNLEWAYAYTKHFGLYSYDPASGERTARDSACFMQTLLTSCQGHSLPGGLF